MAERDFQDARWGADRELPAGVWALILGEEYGEACRAALSLPEETGPVDRMPLRAELVQVAASAVAWIEALDAGRL